MKCSEFHELAAAYALDALSEEERLACAQHLAHESPHDGCDALLARYERAVAALSESVPSVAIDEQVWRALELRSGLAKTTPKQVPRAAPSRTREFMAWGIAAAALLAGFWTMHSKRTALEAQAHLISSFSESARELSQRVERSESARKECVAALERLEVDSVRLPLALSLLEEPATKVVPMVRTGAPDVRATALFNAEQKRALMISSSMRPVAGKDYELWVVASGPPQPAGFVRFDASGVAVGEFDAALLQGKAPAALAVSLEPAGGRPSPTEVVLMVKL